MKRYEYYNSIMSNKNDMSKVNELLNKALSDPIIPSDRSLEYSFEFLCKSAMSVGFTFMDHFKLIR